MKINEALEFPEPQERRIRIKHNKSKKTSNLYFLTIYILITILVVICLYTIAIYNSNNVDTGQFRDTFKVTNTSTAHNSNIDKLINENNTLKEQYKSLEEENRKILELISEIKKQNELIKAKNRALTEDNIELQNSLKMAASVGIKPQNFTSFEGLADRGEINRGNYIGKFLGTAYTPSAVECGNSKGITNSGQPVMAGVSLAVDGRYWPFGTVFYIKGLGYAMAMDTGSAIKGKNRFDFAVFDKKFARKLGSKYWEVYLIRKGNGKIENLNF